MKLKEWLHTKRWNTAIFSRESGISLPTLRKIINEDGGISLDVALMIEKSTDGKVKSWDLSPNADLIKSGKNWEEVKNIWLANCKKKNNTKKAENKEKDKSKLQVDNIG